MLAVVLGIALVAQSTLAAPSSNCAELCDDQNSFGHSKSSSSYSSYSKSSYGQQGAQGFSGSSGLGLTNGRLESLDENVIGTTGLNRPGNWQDEKHYITDDGKGQMSYRAGQTVSNNGYSKFAQHSYSYGSHESHAPISNAQVLTTEQFGSELQNMRNRINSFMGNFHLDIGSTVNANTLQDFKSKANLISNQMSNVCNQVDQGSSMYQQMQIMMNQFHRDVEKKQREMELMMYQNSGISSTTTHGSSYRYPTVPSAEYDEQFSRVQSLISSFYSTFNRPDTNFQFQQDLNNQVDVINSKLADLNYEMVQNESERKRIDQLKKQFENFVSHIHGRIQEIEQRNAEEEAKRKDRELQLKLEKQQQEEKLREEEQLRLQHQEEERIRIRQQEEERIRQEEDKLRLQQQEEERIRLQLEEEEKMRLKLQEQERLHLQLKQEEENKRIRQEQDARLALLQQQQQQSKVKITGSTTYEHSMVGHFETQAQGASSGHKESYNYSPHSKPQPVIQPHVDLTAAMSRLQQDLNRLQTEVNNFNMYTMRLNSANSVTIVGEAERQAEQLRERINNLCETSNRYQNQNIQTSAENLGRRFEELFRSFQNQASNYSSGGSAFSAGYSSESSYGASEHFGAIRKPTVTNVEYEHSKSVDVEVGRRPATSQSYTAGSSYSSTNSYGAHGADDQYRTGLIDLGPTGSSAHQVDCVEMYAGQPCIEKPRRHRRSAGEKQYDSFFDLTQKIQDSQQQQQIITDLNQDTQSVEVTPESKPIRNKIFNQQIQSTIKPQIHNLQQNQKIEDLTRQEGDFDDFFMQQNQNNLKNFSMNSRLESDEKTEDFSQHNKNVELTEELKISEKLENKNLNIAQHQHNQIQLPKSKNLQIEDSIFNSTTKPSHLEPITTFKNIRDENEYQLVPLESKQETERFEHDTFPTKYNHFSQERQQKISHGNLELDKQVTEKQNIEYGHFTSQSAEQNINFLSQKQQQQPYDNLQDADSNQSEYQLKNLSNENNLSTTEKSKLKSSIRATDRPTTEVISRWYSRLFQVNQGHDVTKQPENSEKQSQHKYVRIDQNHNQINFNKPKTDLPYNEKSSTLQSVINDKPTDYQKLYLNHDNVQHRQVNLFENSGFYDSQKPKNDFDINQQLKSSQFNDEEESTHQSNKNHRNNFKDEQQQESYNNNINFKQFEQESSNTEFDQQQKQTSLLEKNTKQKSKDNSVEEKVSSGKTWHINEGSDTESTTTPNTFWKRVGHKLSHSIDKVKERAKTIFG